MRYDPETANEDLWPDGWYDAVVAGAEEKRSKKNNEMLVMTAQCYWGEKKQLIDTYFVSGIKASMTRMKRFCRAIGLDFTGGEVTPDMIRNKNFKAHIKTQSDDKGIYDDKNVITHFAESSYVPPEGEQGGNELDDDIPF